MAELPLHFTTPEGKQVALTRYQIGGAATDADDALALECIRDLFDEFGVSTVSRDAYMSTYTKTRIVDEAGDASHAHVVWAADVEVPASVRAALRAKHTTESTALQFPLEMP
jgi:hypothetical protein